MGNVYIRLYNGRVNSVPRKDLGGECGFDGPVLGPLDLQVTYGSHFKLNVLGRFAQLEFSDDEVVFRDCLYGDFDVHAKYPAGQEAIGGIRLLEELGAFDSMHHDVLAGYLMDATEKAYMRDQTDDGEWKEIILRLLEDGVPAKDVEWILKSKHMRWASDQADDGKLTADIFSAYLSAYLCKGPIRDDSGRIVAGGPKGPSGPLHDRYLIYRESADKGDGTDIVTGKPLLTFDQWLSR